MKRYFFIALLTHLSCAPAPGPTVKNIGELRQIMHQGKYQARVQLDTLLSDNDYALGAMESLSGELLVINGTAFTSKVQADSLVTAVDPDAVATLLVYARVTQWDTLDIAGATDIVSALLQVQSPAPAFPFMLLGAPAVEYHVIHFDTLQGDMSRHKEGALTGTLANTEVMILGFYATGAAGIYTHHDSPVHMHVIDASQTIMGHVDHLDLKGGAYQLLIPKS